MAVIQNKLELNEWNSCSGSGVAGRFMPEMSV